MGYGSSIGGTSTSLNNLAIDTQSLGNLKADAGKNTPESIKETAKQFESLFMRELIKSMREATMKSGMLDNPGSDLGADMLDQQFAVQMSGQPGGLSDLIAQQLTRQMGATKDAAKDAATAEAIKANDAMAAMSETGDSSSGDISIKPTAISALAPASKSANAMPVANASKGHRAPTLSQADFVRRHSDVASKIEKTSGIPASYMLGQAGHETGWGKFEIKHKGGAPSFNLFGIKAGANWKGKVAEVTTTEYVNGTAQKKVARFRAYDSYEDSFRDYASMISESPRYSQAKLQTGSVQAFASGLQKAGYATDPDYAAKLSRAINTTLQLRRVQV